jgi:hypothetical protein
MRTLVWIGSICARTPTCAQFVSWLLRNMVVWGGKEVSACRGVGVGPEPEEMFLTRMGPVARPVMDC